MYAIKYCFDSIVSSFSFKKTVSCMESCNYYRYSGVGMLLKPEVAVQARRPSAVPVPTHTLIDARPPLPGRCPLWIVRCASPSADRNCRLILSLFSPTLPQYR